MARIFAVLIVLGSLTLVAWLVYKLYKFGH